MSSQKGSALAVVENKNDSISEILTEDMASNPKWQINSLSIDVFTSMLIWHARYPTYLPDTKLAMISSGSVTSETEGFTNASLMCNCIEMNEWVATLHTKWWRDGGLTWSPHSAVGKVSKITLNRWWFQKKEKGSQMHQCVVGLSWAKGLQHCTQMAVCWRVDMVPTWWCIWVWSEG